MADHFTHRHPSLRNLELLTFILKSTITRIPGDWHFEDISADGISYAVPDNIYDYLVNVDGINYIIHPEDVAAINTTINNGPSRHETSLSFRTIASSGIISRVYGTVRLPRQSEGSSSTNEAVDTEAIIASRNLLEAVFNTSTLGLHVLRSVRDERGAIVDFDVALTNATSDKIAGRKVSGMRMLEGWPHTKEIGLFDKFIETVETGRAFAYEHLYEGDGVRAWFQWMASRLDDGLYVTIEDITTRKNNEEALKHTADRLQSTFDGVPAIIALLEPVMDERNNPLDFFITAANKALSDFTGCKTEELIGKRMTDLYPEAFRGKLRDAYLKVFASGEPLHLEFLYPGLDRWFSILVTKQVDGQGIVAVALEITEQKKAEEQRKQNQLLAELDRAKMNFFSNVSHEFRTPLTLMLGPLEAVLKRFGDNPAFADDHGKLEMVKRNALSLQKLVNNLLDFSSVEAGRTEAIFQPVDVAEYTTLLAANFRSAIESAGLKFVVDCASTETLYVNPDMWEKIVLNLLSNALKFTFEGKISLVLRSQKRHVKLMVRDTGVGISQGDIPRIFQRFVRIQNARSRTYEGTGIGLALVKELVNIHGGKISVGSKPGEGTVFVVSIPKGKAHLPARNVHELRESRGVTPLSSTYGYEAMNWLPVRMGDLQTTDGVTAGGDGHSGSDIAVSKKIILLVDDNSDLREYIRSILHRHYQVVTANNGASALEIMSQRLIPDLVLTDIMMPELDGYALLKEMKTKSTLSGVPFIFLSARASEEARLEGMRAGADDYLVKPFSASELLARIEARLKIESFHQERRMT